MPQFPILLTVDCKDQTEANAVQQSLVKLAAINGGRGLLNLQKELDSSLVARTMVHKVINRKS